MTWVDVLAGFVDALTDVDAVIGVWFLFWSAHVMCNMVLGYLMGDRA